MNDELLNLLQMLSSFQTTAPVSTQVEPEYAHDSIDTELNLEKENYWQKSPHTMSERPYELHGTGGLGLLDMVGGVAKAGAMIPAGTEGWKQIMTRLRLINPASSDKLNRMSELIRGRPSTSLNPKYKDNPYRELSDIMDDVFKPLEDVNIGGRIPSEYFPSRVRKLQSSELTGKAREAEKILNKSLLEGFEELNEFSKKGLTGYMPQKYEEKIRKWSNTLLDLIK